MVLKSLDALAASTADPNKTDPSSFGKPTGKRTVMIKIEQIQFSCWRILHVGLPVVLPKEEESVLLGSAVLAASASKDFNTIQVRRKMGI